jgi:hypothetical protein
MRSSCPKSNSLRVFCSSFTFEAWAATIASSNGIRALNGVVPYVQGEKESFEWPIFGKLLKTTV